MWSFRPSLLAAGARRAYIRRLAYRRVIVKATWGLRFAAEMRSGKRFARAIVLPWTIG
jgi:hypothetical protein